MEPRPRLAAAAAALALATACGPERAAPPTNNMVAPAAAPAPAAVNTAAPAPAPAPPGCVAAALEVSLDPGSFARETQEPAFPPQRLEAFRTAAASAFRSAADAACAAGEVDPARLAPVRRLVVQSGSGATETTFYDDAESVGPGALVFQWVFLEEDLALPAAADIRAGLACWADPEREGCGEREP
ncbi:MAG TPA: hypothetical protein VGX37_03475 [Allosphingosinicella sp.]|nr:hypothetical protein [Allosphingosinicella sp.]